MFWLLKDFLFAYPPPPPPHFWDLKWWVHCLVLKNYPNYANICDTLQQKVPCMQYMLLVYKYLWHVTAKGTMHAVHVTGLQIFVTRYSKRYHACSTCYWFTNICDTLQQKVPCMQYMLLVYKYLWHVTAKGTMHAVHVTGLQIFVTHYSERYHACSTCYWFTNICDTLQQKVPCMQYMLLVYKYLWHVTAKGTMHAVHVTGLQIFVTRYSKRYHACSTCYWFTNICDTLQRKVPCMQYMLLVYKYLWHVTAKGTMHAVHVTGLQIFVTRYSKRYHACSTCYWFT